MSSILLKLNFKPVLDVFDKKMNYNMQVQKHIQNWVA